MSHETYDKLWLKAHRLLNETVKNEPAQVNSRENRKLLSKLYVTYIMLGNKFGEIVDQMVQPQKLLLVEKILEATLGRVLELKADLVEADLSDYTHVGDAIDELGLTPFHVELKIPECFRLRRIQEIEYRRDIIKSVLDKLGFGTVEIVKVVLTEHQAILIVQTHERARQGRLRAQFMKEMKNLKEKSKSGEESSTKLSLSAALRIQKVWRGFTTRRATKRRKLQEMLLIGMIPPPQFVSEDVLTDLKNKTNRVILQRDRLNELESAVKSCRENLESNQRAVVLEQLGDQVRNWLFEYKTQTGKIPEYTGSERSASRMLMSRQGTGTDSELSKSTPISSKESKKLKQKIKESVVEIEEQMVVKTTASIFLPQLTAQKDEYEEKWMNKNEMHNPHQYYYPELIHGEQMSEMEHELRKVVDEMMKTELQMLQDALDRDRGHKGKKRSGKKQKRTGKKNKKKKEKDLTPDRTFESLFEELIANGIIKLVSEKYLDEFIGETSSFHPVPHNKGVERKIWLGDVRQVLKEYCVVPLLSERLHQVAPRPKSILLAGPTGSGKDALIHAICTETGAMLFDLTPSNIVGKYPGKSGLIMLIHLVIKVARLVQPSVIYMDNAERPFVKKIPKSDKSDPKRLKKELQRIVKNLPQEDRVIFIGVTNNPWEADQKLLQQVYHKYIYIPRPEYGSRFTFFKHILSKNDAIGWQFDYSAVSKISDGYTIGAILTAIRGILTVKRTLQLRVRPLNQFEVINALAKLTPVYKEEEDAMTQWWSKTPMVKRKNRTVEALFELEEEMKAKQANAKRK